MILSGHVHKTKTKETAKFHEAVFFQSRKQSLWSSFDKYLGLLQSRFQKFLFQKMFTQLVI